MSAENVTKRRGRPAGTYGPIKRIQDAADRTPEESLKYFKERKNINRNKPQMSYRELTNRVTDDNYRLEKFMHSLK